MPEVPDNQDRLDLTKFCGTCSEHKPLTSFWKNKANKNGYQRSCKDCHRARREPRKAELKQYMVEYNRKNKTVLDAKRKAYYAKDPQKWAEYYRGYDETREGTEERRTYRRESQRRKRANDPNVVTKDRLRARLSTAIRRDFRAGSAVRDLGCSIPEFRAHIEARFREGMGWENWGKGKGKWNIDHIVPLDAFDLTNRQHVLLACNYLNLQPLWAEENASKGCKVEF